MLKSMQTFLANVNGSLCHRRSVCLSSITFVRPTQASEVFGIILRNLVVGTLAIPDLSEKILRRSSQGNPSVGG